MQASSVSAFGFNWVKLRRGFTQSLLFPSRKQLYLPNMPVLSVHDQLQAIVGGLPGLALEERNSARARIVGTPPRREDGHWCEGFIVLPMPPARPVNTAKSTRPRFLD